MTPDSLLEPQISVNENILALSGVITFRNVGKAWQKGLDKINNMPDRFSVDLAGLTQCDSSGLALCTAWRRAAYQQKKDSEFINIPDFMQGLFRVYGLEKIFMVDKDSTETSKISS